jgi:hypothetical protein
MNAVYDLAILRRVLNLDQRDLSPAFAREVLKWEPRPQDQARLHELTRKNQRGELTAEEQSELDSFLRVGRFLDLLRSRARLALKKSEVVN